jgi:hypothetical protein
MSNSTAFLPDESGFAVCGLRSPSTEIRVAVDLGAKIISLKNLETGREWMWRPPGSFELFRNELGDTFERSTLVGADECLPTIAPCNPWRQRVRRAPVCAGLVAVNCLGFEAPTPWLLNSARTKSNLCPLLPPGCVFLIASASVRARKRAGGWTRTVRKLARTLR